MIVPASNRIPTRKTSPRGNLVPVGICIHNTAGADGRLRSRPRTLRERITDWAADFEWKSSTDFVCGRNPKVDSTLQMVASGINAADFTRYTWHAGGSVWRGHGSPEGVRDPDAKVNQLLIGVDADNYGPLELHNGQPCYRRTRTQKVQGVPAVKFPGPVYLDKQGNAWEAYTDELIEELCRVVYRVCEALPSVLGRITEYPGAITDTCPIVGHETINTHKVDPGPAFDTAWPAIYNSALGRYVDGVCEL